MVSSSFFSIVIQIYLLSFNFVVAFHTPTTYLSRGGFSRLNSFVSAKAEAIQLKPSFLSSVRDEIGRTINIIFNAPLERKIVVLAHPLIIFLLYLLATSKMTKNVGQFFSDCISNAVSSIKSSMVKSPKTSAFADSLAKGKTDDRKPKGGEGKPIRSAADTALFAEKELSRAASAAMAAKLADLEAKEIAYMKAQKLKREAAMRAANDKAKAIEIERSRVMSISKVVRVYDEFRSKHDPNFRRWKNQPSADKLREEEALIADEQKLAGEELQRQYILTANLIEDARKSSVKEENENRSAAKAAADKVVKDGQLAYAAQVKEKADKAARIKVNNISEHITGFDTYRCHFVSALHFFQGTVLSTYFLKMIHVFSRQAEKIAHAAAVAAEKRKLDEEVAAVRQWRKEEAFVNAKRNILEQLAAMEKTQSSHWTPQNMVEE